MRSITEVRSGQNHGPITAYVHRHNLADLNPFVLWDHFFIPNSDDAAGFGFHGHSGVATISYPLIGDIEHKDTAGHTGRLKAGGIQLMSSGAGVLHKETVYPDTKSAEAFQLWTLLPAQEEEMGPVRYSSAQSGTIPVLHSPQGHTKILIGEHRGTKSPVHSAVDMTYLHVALNKHTSWQHALPHQHKTAFIFIRTGELDINGRRLSSGQLGVFDQIGQQINVNALENDADFLLATGAPLDQALFSSGASIHSNQRNLDLGTANIQQLLTDMNAH